MSKELPKVYDPKGVEQRIYDQWVKNDCFKGIPDKNKKPFSVVIPPPNVTGQLHMGHALNDTMQDILVRTKRMQGYSTLWVPGTDHAGIATQIKVEEQLRVNEGVTRYDIGREEFLKRVWAWKEKYGNRIIFQLKQMGVSCDWSQERFTMDEGLSKAVREAFVRLYNKGLIYRGYRIINWCPHCRTALSDAEVEYSEQPSHLWHLRYKVKDSDEYIIVATTRPETMMGDTGVAVNPDDERYKHLIGKTCILPIMNREIPIFGDEYVDREFGTGCVKVTPCHDPNDYEMALRHDLEQILVINENGVMNENAGMFNGMDRDKARVEVVKELERIGALVRVEDYNHNVGTCYRCHNNVEPMASRQWFVKMKPLAENAIKVVNDGDVRFVPDRFAKIYLNWMENVHDWCISRQLWWGHRIPAFYCEKCGEMTVSKEDIDTCPKCGGHVVQEEDVLDTWFSSALWPFSTLGWPENTEFLKYYYPTSVLVTAYDIIFFWVARMIFSGMEYMEEKPFSDVLIHGLVRDAQGRKMSKSLGNGIDPIEVIDKYGADALRFTLVTGNSPGNDIRFSWDKVESSRNFANKVWNASRFVLMNMPDDFDGKLPEKLELEDKWILTKLNETIERVTENIEKYELGIAAQKMYDFIWTCFCDWYIELVKPRLMSEDIEAKKSVCGVLCYVLDMTMRMLHPIMPFITEEIWQQIPHEGSFIMTSEWPKFNDKLNFPKEALDMEIVMETITAIRARRSDMGVPPSKKAQIMILTDKKAPYENGRDFIMKLAYASSIEYIEKTPEDVSKLVSVITTGAKVYMPMNELVDMEKEIERINREREKVLSEIKRVDGKLSNPGFVSKAPEALIEAEKAKKVKFEELLKKLDESLEGLK